MCNLSKTDFLQCHWFPLLPFWKFSLDKWRVWYSTSFMPNGGACSDSNLRFYICLPTSLQTERPICLKWWKHFHQRKTGSSTALESCHIKVNLLTAENRLNDFSTQFNFHSPEFIKCLKHPIKSVHYYLKYLTADTETAAVIWRMSQMWPLLAAARVCMKEMWTWAARGWYTDAKERQDWAHIKSNTGSDQRPEHRSRIWTYRGGYRVNSVFSVLLWQFTSQQSTSSW